jgi:hypothetical protein
MRRFVGWFVGLTALVSTACAAIAGLRDVPGADSDATSGEGGECEAGAPCTPIDVCHVGVTSCTSGAVCNDTGNAAKDGTPCGTHLVCQSGTCVTCQTGASCAPANVCDLGTLDCSSGTATCNDTGKPVAAGTSCGNSGEQCSQGACYSVLADQTKWTTFDVSTVDPGASGFLGGEFDGRYLYLVPYYNGSYDGVVARYDTQAFFDSKNSWATTDVSTLDPNAVSFYGGRFDGRYLYLVPYETPADTYNSVMARFDTTGSFSADSGAWSTVDVSKFDPGSQGFAGAAFDGQYLYLVPYGGSSADRYAVQGPLDAGASWSHYPLGSGYTGAVFDGRYVYVVSDSPTSGVVQRYDPQLPFTAPTSWVPFDVSTTPNGAHALGFGGAVFDGRYLYLAPGIPSHVGAPYLVAARFDTQASGGFVDPNSWQTFPLDPVIGSTVSDIGYYGATFDGRYVYFAPSTGKDLNNKEFIGSVVLRYDTQGSFTGASAWSTYDVTLSNPGAAGFLGAVFDGRYVYLAPYWNGSYDGIVARFDAKSPASVPPVCANAAALHCTGASL